MDLNNSNINLILNKYINFTNKLCLDNNYDNNIRHLLYIIIPAFIIRYGINNEKTILDCFLHTKINISYTENKQITAYFYRTIHKNDNNYFTKKSVVLNEYKTASMTGLLDNIIHEFNHAVNSVNNEIKVNDKKIMLRTGLCYFIYDINNINNFEDKTKDLLLEEVINTKQTADIINIINSFSAYEIENEEFNNILYSLKHEIGSDFYKSNAYALGSYITDELINNKTFIPTIENLRFKGLVDDIPSWFDNVTGHDGSYFELIKTLYEIEKLEQKYRKAKLFKNAKLNVIRDKIKSVMGIIKDFDNKCIFK